MVDATVAFILVSSAAALRAIPPQPQIPMIPILVFYILHRLPVQAIHWNYFRPALLLPDVKPFIRCGSMPVLNTCRNIDAVTWLHFYSLPKLYSSSF
jgi:hypothetical protein